MSRSVPKSKPSSIPDVKTQLHNMRSKQRRLCDAIRQREKHLARLEASAALAVETPPVRSRHGMQTKR